MSALDRAVAELEAKRAKDEAERRSRQVAAGTFLKAFFEAVQEAGYPLTDDVNGYSRKALRPSTATFTRDGGSVRRARISIR